MINRVFRLKFIGMVLLCLSFGIFLYPQVDKPIDKMVEPSEEGKKPQADKTTTKPKAVPAVPPQKEAAPGTEDLEPVGPPPVQKEATPDSKDTEALPAEDSEVTETIDMGKDTGEETDESVTKIEDASTFVVPSFPSIEQREKAEFLVLGKTKIYRFKFPQSLSNDEIGTYLQYIRKGGIHVGIENEFEHIAVVESGGELMKYITYNHLCRLISYIGNTTGKDAEIEKAPTLFSFEIKKVIFSDAFVLTLLDKKEANRVNIIESALGGLLNPDPQVRLVSIYLLRRLIPYPKTWNFVNDRIKETDYGKTDDPDTKLDSTNETVKTTSYKYLHFNKFVDNKVVFSEMVKLRRFISRFILVEQIQGGDRKSIKDMPIELFKLISMPIEDEGVSRIPMNYFSANEEIDVIIAGIGNNDVNIQKGCVDTLIRIVRTRQIEDRIRLKAFRAILRSPLREKVAVGWTEEEINVLSPEEADKMLKRYLRKVGKVNPTIITADDQYDRPDPIEYVAEKFTDKPIVKGDDEDLTQADLEKVRAKENKTDSLEENYILEK